MIDSPLTCEPPLWRYACLAFCLIALLAFYLFVTAANAPAFPGVDQNGYLFGGRTLLEHGARGYTPQTPDQSQLDPYGFVGRMWIGVDLGTPNERYYPKYPLGYPALVALAYAIAGPTLAYAINPLAMTLALLFSFLLIREIAGSTLALLTAIVLATLPVICQLANNPNSHATALLFVTASMFFLLSWTERGRWHRLALAAFCAGYAATIRYTEALLILPLLIACFTQRPFRFSGTADRARTPPSPLFNFPWRDRLIMFSVWLLPIAALLAYNLVSFGSLTGYDPTNESTGFRLEYAADNYLTMLEQFATRGFALFLPFAIAGLIALCNWRPRLAAILLAWTVPTTLAYTFYYWAPDNTNTVGYMRFFLTILPALLAAAMALFAGLMTFRHDESPHPSGRRFWIIIVAALSAVAVLLNLGQAVPDLLNDQVRRLALLDRTRAIQSVAPPGSVIFSSDTSILHHLQFVADYTLYSTDIFNTRRVETMGAVDPDEPTGFQPQRQLALYERLKDKSAAELWAQARALIQNAQQQGHPAFVIEPLRITRGRTAPFSLQPLITAKGWSIRQVAAWANTTVGDHPPVPGERRMPRRKDLFFNYRAARDAGSLIQILPPPPEFSTPPEVPPTPEHAAP